jgi:ribose transport system permease protein
MTAATQNTASTGEATRPERPARSRQARAIVSRYGLLLAWLVVIIVFSLLRPETFFTASNAQTILGTQAILLVLTIGLLPPLMAGEYDLSIAGVLSVSYVLIGHLNVNHGWPILAAIVVVGVESIVATLGMGTLLIGLGFGINQTSVGGISESLVNTVRHQVLGIQAVFYVGLALTIATWYVFTYTPLGRYLYFVGTGREVARLAGIRVELIRAGSLMSASVLSALAGVLLAGVLGSSDPNAAAPYLLPAFAGAFLGATTITPGRFNAWGSFIAVYFLVTGITGLELLGLSGWIEQVFYGASLTIAVAISRLAGRT